MCGVYGLPLSAHSDFLPSGGASLNRTPESDTDDKTHTEGEATWVYHTQCQGCKYISTLETFYFCLSRADKCTRLR